MTQKKIHRIGFRLVALLLSLILCITLLSWLLTRFRSEIDSLAGFPRVFLWAWERPEHLEFLDPSKAGVAILANTLALKGARLYTFPRMQPIALPPGVTTLAVIRIETESMKPTPELLNETVQEIMESAVSTPASGIQIDFDAVKSERLFYREMLEELRKQLPPEMKLSITALASWCLYDDWISTLPVDEAVPMLFRLGCEEENVRRYLGTGRDFRPAISKFSVGISMDELPSDLPRGRRIYIFNPEPWTEESVEQALHYARNIQ
jgi:hypothetical protein